MINLGAVGLRPGGTGGSNRSSLTGADTPPRGPAGIIAGVVQDLVAVERVIDAAPGAIFDVLADPAKHPLIDGSGTVRAARTGNPARLTKGAEFGMDMRLVGPYRITNRVVEFEEGRRIAWRHFGPHRWRYLLTPVAGGTLVREEWDATRAPKPVQIVLQASGFPERNRRGMAATLARLADVVTSRDG